MGGCCPCGKKEEDKPAEAVGPPGSEAAKAMSETGSPTAPETGSEPPGTPGSETPGSETFGSDDMGMRTQLPITQVGSIGELGVDEFRTKMGELAPTTPLVIVFVKTGDDVMALSDIMTNLNQTYQNVFFLTANVEKNEKAANDLNVTDTPTWVAFKNHTATGSYVGDNPGSVEGLVKSVIPEAEGGVQPWFGGALGY